MRRLQLYRRNYILAKELLIQKTEDVQLGMMIEIVKEYGNEIPGIIKEIKSKHIKNDGKERLK